MKVMGGPLGRRDREVRVRVPAPGPFRENHMKVGERKAEFIKALAKWLAGPNSAHMSILLEMKNPQAEMWARIRDATPISGWASVEEAERVLTEFLS